MLLNQYFFYFTAAKIAENAADISGGDYIGENGLIFCGNCHTPKQTDIAFQGKTSRVYILCKCAAEKYEDEKAAHKKADEISRIQRLREAAIPCRNLWSWTFSKDNGSNPDVIRKARKYADNWDDMFSQNIGLLFFGDVGRGKSFAAFCIANALVDKGVRVMTTDFGYILNAMQSPSITDKNAFLEPYITSDLLVIDDLGAERPGEYALQVVEQVIDGRCKEGKPLILTTNIPLDVLKNPPDMKYSRIYSRILGMTLPIKVDGDDRRKAETANKHEALKKLFITD